MANVHRLYPYAVYPADGSPTQKETWARSERFMIEDLGKSGLTPDDIQAFPLCMTRAPATAGYVIPYFDTGGNILRHPQTGVFGHMHRIRLYLPPNTPRDVAKNFSRYLQPSRREVGEESTRPYLTQNWSKAKKWALVEGEKKAAALAKRWGYGVIGIGGFGNWGHHDPQIDGLNGVILDALELLPDDAELLVIPDGDAVRFDIGASYSRLCGYLRTQAGVTPRVVNMARMSPNKIDDWLVRYREAGPEVVAEWEEFDFNLVPVNRDALVNELNLIPNGVLLMPNEYNVLTILDRHPMWEGAFKINEDTLSLTGGLESYIEARVTTESLARLQALFHMPRLTHSVVKRCIGAVAWKYKFSPLRDWLTGLVWDGVDRLGTWLIQVGGAKDTPFVREVSKKIIIAACARKMFPGCMVDYMVVLKGAQGIGKSSLWVTLFGRENTIEFIREGSEGKDRMIIHHMGWCVVDEELGSLSRKDTSSNKGYITRRHDNFRAPYAVEAKDHPRQFVYVGTTNSDSFLHYDSSGYRRYAPVELFDLVDFKTLESIREQLLAQGMFELRKGVCDYSQIYTASETAESYVTESFIKDDVINALGRWKKTDNYKNDIDAEGYHCLKIKDVMSMCAEEAYAMRNVFRIAEYKSVLIALGFEWRTQGRVRGLQFNGHVRIKSY